MPLGGERKENFRLRRFRVLGLNVKFIKNSFLPKIVRLL